MTTPREPQTKTSNPAAPDATPLPAEPPTSTPSRPSPAGAPARKRSARRPSPGRFHDKEPGFDVSTLRHRLYEPLMNEEERHAETQVEAARANDFQVVEDLALAHKHRQLQALQTVEIFGYIRAAALSNMPMDERLSILLEETRTLFRAQVAAILLMDEEGEKLWPRVSLGFETTLGVRPIAINGAIRRVIETGVSLVLAEVEPDAEFRVGLIEEGIHSLVAAAIRIDEANQGVVVCGHREPGRFSEGDARLLELVADQMGGTLGARRRLEAQTSLRRKAEQASAFKTDLLNMATHDIKTPLTALALQLRLLQGGKTTDELRQKSISVMDRSVKHLTAMLDDFLDLARVQADRLTMHPRRLNLSALLKEAVEMFDAAAKEAGLVLVLEPSEGLEALGDEPRIQQVVANLLSNAIRYSPRGAQVRITLHDGRDHVEVHVIDTGRGMTPAQLARLFQPFTEVHEEPGRSKGTGLGLYLSKAIVNAHGGRLLLTSPGPGRGTDAAFTLPKEGAARPSEPSPFHDTTKSQPPHSPADPANA